MDVLESRLAKVFLDTDAERPPRHPGLGWTRFVCISDTHSRRFPVPPGDVLIHAGDLSHYSKNLTGTIEWLKTLDHPLKMSLSLPLCLPALIYLCVESLQATMMSVLSLVRLCQSISPLFPVQSRSTVIRGWSRREKGSSQSPAAY